VPDLVADVGRRRRGDPGRLQRRSQGLDAGSAAIVRLADPEDVAVRHFVVHHARLDDVVRRADDGTHHTIQADGLGEHPARIQPRQIRRRRARCRKPVSVPPGNAVLHEGHRRLGAQQRADAVGKDMLARGLHGHQHRILRPEIGWPIGGLDRRHDLLVAGEQSETPRSNRLEMRPARYDGNLMAGGGEPRGEVSADGARAEYTNPHAPLSDPAVGWSAERGGNNHGRQR
jgi:hypothetical protein